MRTAVPLVRRLDPSGPGPIELEFDVAALRDDDTPPLFVGVRISGEDPAAVADEADQLSAAQISARLHLLRLEPSGPIPTTLMHGEWVSRSESRSIALPEDSAATGLLAFDADYSTMQAAGLLSEGVSYQELALAYTPGLPTGRYRLVLDIGVHRGALAEADAELLMAYTSKGK